MLLLGHISTAFDLDLGKNILQVLHSFQSGFRQNILLETRNNCFLDIDKGEYNIAVFLDLQKALTLLTMK